MTDQKLSNKERLRQITESIETGIKELFESDKYRQYLSTMSRFHHYSLNNTMLIYMQKPDATLVAGFNKWMNQFERQVKKGEHGITIIAPTPFKKKIEEQKLDPDTKAPVLDKDGKIVTEEKEVEIPMFRPVKVFDVSQTDGKPLPQLASDLSGGVAHYDVFMEALRRTSSVPIQIQPISDGSDGYFNLTAQRIDIRKGMSEVQTVSATVHEMAHSILHNTEKEQLAAAGDGTKEQPKPKDRRTEEVEAESISYAVCQYFGIQTGENSFGYIAAWSKGKELAELKASLETINKTASSLINGIERNFKEICKERGIDLTAPEPERPEGAFRYYITPEALAHGSYPFMLGGQIHESSELTEYAGGTVKSYGYIDYPQPLTDVQAAECSLSPAADNPPIPTVQSETLTYYVAECMEFPSLGEYHENLSLEEAVRLYPLIPAERMNGIKGIGFELQDESGYDGQFPILSGQTIDVESINSIEQFKNSPLVQKAVSDLIAAMPDMEVEWGERFGTVNQPRHSVMDEGGGMRHIRNGSAVSMLPEAPEQTLDEYPMPDFSLTVNDLEKAGYRDGDMLPLSKERAMELYEQDLTVYAVVDGGSAGMLFDREEFELQLSTTIFAVSRKEWEESPAFDGLVQDRKKHQEKREQAFLSHKGDCFAIYQLRDTEEMREIHFEGTEWLKSIGRKVERENYDLIYTAPLDSAGKGSDVLEQLFYQFNNEHPADYHSPSLSVSDIVAIRQADTLSCYYVDSFGFAPVPDFIKTENYLKAAEMSAEDDYNMIDGILNNGPKQPTVDELEQQARSGQPISLMALAEAAHRENQEKKKSVMKQLKSKSSQENKKTALKKSAEREL